MAREKSLDLAVVQTWLAAWGESDIFSDAAVHHLQSLIADTHCLVVITLGVGRDVRSLVFRRVNRVLGADHGPCYRSQLHGRLQRPSCRGEADWARTRRSLPSRGKRAQEWTTHAYSLPADRRGFW